MPTRTVPQHSDSGTAQRVEPPSVDFTTARTCDTRATAHTTVLRSNMVVSLGQPPARLAGLLLLLPSLLLRHSEALDNGAARLPPLGTKSHSSCTHSALQVVSLSLAARSLAIRRWLSSPLCRRSDCRAAVLRLEFLVLLRAVRHRRLH